MTNTEQNTLTPTARVARSKVLGDYYRDLSVNYREYEESGNWPERPQGYEKPYCNS